VDEAGLSTITEPQLVTVVIATRNRGIGAVRTIESIIGSEDSPCRTGLELIIVDQSDNDATESAVAPYLQLAIF